MAENKNKPTDGIEDVDQNTTTNDANASAKDNKGVDKLLKGVAAKLAKCKKATIKVPLNQLNKADTEVTVSINGYIYQIQRGVEVTVPLPVKKLLERAGHI